jgi:hypothetical protein
MSYTPKILVKERQKSIPEPSLFEGGLLFEKESSKSDNKGLRARLSCPFEFYRTAIFLYISILLLQSK